jgi:RimJ/RimL family protein N-acetyltransferase
VTLRQITAADAPALFAVFGDPEVTRFWSSPPLADLAAAKALVTEIHDHFEAGRLFQWAVTLAGGDELVGTVTLADIDEANGRAEIGFALRRDAWGRGLASEAVRVLIDLAFSPPLALHSLEADVDPDNAAALQLLERMGFAREGHLRERWHHLGTFRDTIFLGLLAREWPPRKQA